MKHKEFRKNNLKKSDVEFSSLKVKQIRKILRYYTVGKALTRWIFWRKSKEKKEKLNQ